MIAIAFVTLLFLLALWRTGWAIAVLIAMFPLEIILQSASPVFVDRSYLFNIAVAMLAGVAVIRRMAVGENPFRNLMTPVSAAAWMFYVWGCASLLWTPSNEAMLSVVGGLPYWILLLVLAPMLLPRVELLMPMATATLLVGMATTMVILADPKFDYYAGRFGLQVSLSQRTNPLALGTLGGTMMVIAALTLLSQKSIFAKGWRAAGFFAGAGLCILSGSRGQMIFAVLISFAFIPIAYRMKNARGLVIGGVVAVIVLAGLYFATSRFVSSENEERWSAESLTTGGLGRVDNVLDLLGTWLQSPGAWFPGLGVMAFDSINARSGDKYSHVMFADAFAELGLLGATLLITALILSWKNIRHLLALLDGDPLPRQGVTIVAALAAYQLLLANKQGMVLGSPLLFTFMIVLARARKEYDLRPHDEFAEEFDEAPEDEEHEEVLVASAGNHP